MQNLLHSEIHFPALGIVGLCHGVIHQFIDLRIVIMGFVDAGTRADQAAAVITEYVHAAAVKRSLMLAVCGAQAQTGRIEFLERCIDADIFQLCLSKLAACLAHACGHRDDDVQRFVGAISCSFQILLCLLGVVLVRGRAAVEAVLVPAPHGLAEFALAFPYHIKQFLAVDAVAHGKAHISVIERRFLVVHRKILNARTLVLLEFKPFGLADVLQFAEIRLIADIDLAGFKCDQARGSLRHIAHCEALGLGLLAPEVVVANQFEEIAELIGIDFPRACSDFRAFCLVGLHCFFIDDRRRGQRQQIRKVHIRLQKLNLKVETVNDAGFLDQLAQYSCRICVD